MENKICSKCSLQKNINEFHKSKNCKYGVRTICKNCENTARKERYLRDRIKCIEYQKEYRESEKGKETYQKYRASEKAKELSRLARSKRRKLVNGTCDKTINYDSTQELLIKQKYQCTYCLKNIAEHKTRHLDHIYPLNKGGKHTISNVQWLCCKCNFSKHDKII